jgi:hypothetical protein
MKHIRIICLLAVLNFTIGAIGQVKPAAPAASPSPGQPAPQAQPTPQPAPTVAAPIDRQVGIIEREIVG